MVPQYLAEEGLGLCQRITSSPDVFVRLNLRGTTGVVKILLLLASSNHRCLYSLCPVLPSQPYIETRANYFETSSRTTCMAFLLD
jgi:hypothetical protein